MNTPQPEPHPLNVPGPFSVTNGCCLTCDVPRFIAPGLFKYATEGGAHCHIYRQPATAADFRKMVEILNNQELSCIRCRSHDADLVQMLRRKGVEEWLIDSPGSTLMAGIKVAIFDLGDTLVEYEGLPPSWVEHYDAALTNLAQFLGCEPTEPQLRNARERLSGYNTRLHPRTVEFAFSRILSDLKAAFQISYPGNPDDAARAFFQVFRQRLRCFPDTRPVLNSLRSAGIRVGVLTDVPYGMPRILVEEDMSTAGVLELVDELVTSVDAGGRKPDCGGLEYLAFKLRTSPTEMIFVGNEKKDIEVALAFGCKAVLLDRPQANPDWKQDATIKSLAEL